MLETRFGEDSSRARTTARVLLESAVRAGLLRDGRVDLSLVRDPVTNFTDSEFRPWTRVRTLGTIAPEPACEAGQAPQSAPGRQRGCRSGRRDVNTRCGAALGRGRPVDRRGQGSAPYPRQAAVAPASCSGSRRVWRSIGVPVGLLAASGSGPATQPAAQHHVTLSDGVAKRSVLAALSATTDSGSFAFSYQLSETPYQEQHGLKAPSCSGASSCPPPRVPRAPRCRGRERSTRIRWPWRRRPPSARTESVGSKSGSGSIPRRSGRCRTPITD